MTPNNSTRVLVVDDSFFMRKVIADTLQADPAIEVVGQARNGREALELLPSLRPDVVTLDLIMPELDGRATLEQIMQQPSPPAVIVVAAHSPDDAAATLDCLAAGAFDFILKPSGSDAWKLDTLAPILRDKVRAAADIHIGRVRPHSHHATGSEQYIPSPPGIVVIGSSTGGPVALEHLLPQIPSTVSYPIVIAQHMPAQFVESLAARLAAVCHLPITVGQDGQALQPGTVYFCQGGSHTQLVRAGNEVRIQVRESSEILTPSIDKLFASAATVYDGSALGIVLTGMGKDSVAGAQAIKDRGGHIFVQNKDSALIFGMGRAVAEAQLADAELPLEEITNQLVGSHG